MTKDDEPDALHLRLEVLWKSLMKIDFLTAVIAVDYVTLGKLMNSHLAWHVGSLMYDKDGNKWRGIPFEVKRAFIPTLRSEDSEPPKSYPISSPFCLYIDAVNPSGRHVYLDDPETDKTFK